jgi:hypothetical protein
MLISVVRLTPEGMESLNQHCTVKAFILLLQLNPPVLSMISTRALPGKAAASPAGRGPSTAVRRQRAERNRCAANLVCLQDGRSED